jgi:Zn-dependent protease with chaperone function
MKDMWRRAMLVFLVALGCLEVSAQRTTLKPGWNLYSKQQDIEIGREAAKEAERQVRLLNDAALNRYVTDIGRKLSRYAPDSDYPFTFKVIHDKNINAFALPGGPIYINSGVLEQADNESQLAGVIGHEIGHVVMRHGTNNATKAQALSGLGAIVGGVLGGSAAGQIATMATQFGLSSVFLKYGRDAERQADILGAQMLYDAGYSAVEMAQFFEKLQGQRKGQSAPEWLSSHPNPGNRVTLVQGEVRKLGPSRGAPAESAQFAAMRQTAANYNRNIPAGGPRPATSGPSGGAAPPVGTPPSSTLRRYNGRGFRIAHPENWEVFEGDAVAIGPREGVARDGISLGALVSVFQPRSSSRRGSAINEATSQLLEDLQRTNPGLRAVSAPRAVSVSGMDARSVTLSGRSPIEGKSEVDWLITVLRPDGSLWYVVFIAPSDEFNRYRPLFQEMLGSVSLSN